MTDLTSNIVGVCSNQQIQTVKEPFRPSGVSKVHKLDLKNSNSVIENVDVLERNSTLNT